MEREPIVPGPNFRLVARTQSIEDAEQIARQYEAQGFTTEIVRKSHGGLAIYEVWAGKEPDALT